MAEDSQSLGELEAEFEDTMEELRLNEEVRISAKVFLAVLKQKSEQTYAHSLRVGLLARRIARFMHLDEKALFFAGIFHDLGKIEIPLTVLHKVIDWTEKDATIMEDHVLASYRILRDKFNFSGDIILWHHRFQPNPYPAELPLTLQEYSSGTRVLIQEYGRILAIADFYDALHRKNNKVEEGRVLTGEEIRQKMLESNFDRKDLIEELYNVGILDRGVIITDTPSGELYEQAWSSGSKHRHPDETARLVALAAVLEPIADKAGCTTRFADISRHLKLEYFVVGGINIGQELGKLAADASLARARFDFFSEPFTGIYSHALRAQRVSLKNRSGGRINQGIIELLVPIIAAQHYFDSYRELIISTSIDDLMEKSLLILERTDRNDVNDLIRMKQLAHNLCRYNDRLVPEYLEAKNVLEYYTVDLASSATPTGIAHNGEFANGFPTVRLMYGSIMNSSCRTFVKKVEEAFRHGVRQHDSGVGRGFLADCIAVAIYLCLSENPKIRLVI